MELELLRAQLEPQVLLELLVQLEQLLLLVL